MKKPLFTAALMTCLWASACIAQQDSPQPRPNPPAEATHAAATPGTGSPAPAVADKSDGDKTMRRAAVELDDGSLLMGLLPADLAFPMQSADLKVDIAIKWIDTITLSGDHKKAVIEMRNGDRMEGVLDMKALPLKMVVGPVSVEMSHVKNVKVLAEGEASAQGLMFWNTLASEKDAGHSAVGPGLAPYLGGGDPDWDVAGGREFITGNHGGAVTIKGAYKTGSRVHNLVLGDLGRLINPEQGCIEFWYCQVGPPVPYHHGIYRMFDGVNGLGSCARIDATADNLEFKLNCGGELQTVDFPMQNVPDKEWIHLAAVWNRTGIEGTTETLRLYINGKKVAAASGTNWGKTAGGQADICGGTDDQCAGKFLMNNLKIWNYSRTSFEPVLNDGH